MKTTIQAWLRSSLQSTMLLGLVMIGLLWSSIWVYLEAEKETLRKNAFQDSANLARSFEQHISSIVHGEDGTLVMLRALYQKSPSTSSLSTGTAMPAWSPTLRFNIPSSMVTEF